MISSFEDIENHVHQINSPAVIVLACAHDNDALSSLTMACSKGIARGVLVGHSEKIYKLLEELGQESNDYEIIQCEDEKKSARLACDMVKEHKADIPMKGLMQTSSFMRALLDKEQGFVPHNGMLSQATLFEFSKENRMLLASDCAVNIQPTYEEKLSITQNAVDVARLLGFDLPRVAFVTPVELVKPSISSTTDAALLAKAVQRGQIYGCIADGPLALDNALNAQAARHKGIVSEVAGRADVLILPDLNTGNVFTKSLTYLAGLPTAGVLCGVAVPVVMSSRTDNTQDKYNTILTALYLSHQKKI